MFTVVSLGKFKIMVCQGGIRGCVNPGWPLKFGHKIQGYSRIFLAKFKDICGVLAAYSVISVKLHEENNHTSFSFFSL
jgi:hypothetical protein